MIDNKKQVEAEWRRQFEVGDTEIAHKTNNIDDKLMFLVSLVYGVFCYIVGLVTAYLIYLVH